MATQEHYSLRWNNHQNHILRAFDTLLQTKTLVDVTLVCAETSIRAHKVVLSACSPFFQRVFSETPCKHPVIVLKDFRGWVVQAIVDFMYRGEISVPQERLQTLIQAGESLQVRGLIDHPVAGNTPTPAASPDEFSVIDDSMDNIINTSSKLLIPPVFVDTMTNHNVTGHPESCTSPMPRRKQARPRRRSGDCAPQDLSQSKPCTPAPQSTSTSQTSSTNVTKSSTSTTSTASTITTTTTTHANKTKTLPTSPSMTPNDDMDDEDNCPETFSENEHDIENDDTEMPESKRKKEETDDVEQTPVKQETRPASSLADGDENGDGDDEEPSTNDRKDNSERDTVHQEDDENDHDDENEPDHDEDAVGDEEEVEDDESENTQKSNEGPENLCTKTSSSNNNNNEQTGNNNSNNRIVLSLRDIRHLNRPSLNSSSSNQSISQPQPPNSHHPPESRMSPVQSHPLNLNNHASLGHYMSSKHDAHRPADDDDRDERMDHDGQFMDQMELSLAHHSLLHNSHAMEHLAGLSSKEFKEFKEFSQSQLMNPLPHFGQHQDGHHPNSPINLPHMPSISSLTMTPPHSE